MTRYKQLSILIPLKEDEEVGSGQLHPTTKWKMFEDYCMVHHEGITMDTSTKRGKWIDPDTGKLVEDESCCYIVAVKEQDVEKFKDYLAEVCTLFCQKCLYVESGGIVEFIEGRK